MNEFTVIAEGGIIENVGVVVFVGMMTRMTRMTMARMARMTYRRAHRMRWELSLLETY